jgi:aspartate aminotransferase
MTAPLIARTANPIMAVAAAAEASGRQIRLWFGESDVPTPEVICAAAARALAAGDTFYAPRRGLPELRDALAAYQRRVHGIAADPARITVTASGMSAIMIALQAVVTPGSNVVVIAPAWPNIIGAVAAVGAHCKFVSLRYEQGWHLDLDALFAAVDGDTKAIYLASPGNPTGWVCESNAQHEIVAFCASRGIHLIADEVYERFANDRPVAPTALGLARDGAPVIVANSFSKTWAMTGWRLGWLAHPAEADAGIGELNAVSTTGAATFVQRAGIVALQEGDAIIETLRARCARGRACVEAALADHPRVRMLRTSAGFYGLLAIDGVRDDLAYAVALASATGVGLAPGSAFGGACNGYLRLCFALSEARLQTAMERLRGYVANH